MKIPHTLVLLFGMIVLAYALTWVVPAGTFEMATDEGHEVVVPGTFSELEGVDKLPVWSVFTVIPRGLGAAQGIIFFIFLIGGALAVVRSTGVIDAVLARMLKQFGNQPALLIFLSMLAVAVGSSTIGMSEEFIPFTPVLILLCVGMGMDAIVAASILIVGSGIGYGAATINPFTVLVAKELAGVPLESGLVFRLILFVPFFLIGFWHIWRYATKVRKDPSASLVQSVGTELEEPEELKTALTSRHTIILVLIIATLGVLVWGIKEKGWYFVELGAVFTALAIVCGLIAGKTLDTIAKTFSAGAAELTGTALLIGFARSIEMILTDAQVLHTIVNALAEPLSNVGGGIAASGMFVIPEYLQPLYSLRLRPSLRHHPHYGSSLRSNRHLTPSSCPGLPDGRWLHEHDHPYRLRPHGHPRHGPHPLRPLVQIRVAPDAAAHCGRVSGVSCCSSNRLLRECRVQSAECRVQFKAFKATP